jgi:hypothetical protein
MLFPGMMTDDGLIDPRFLPSLDGRPAGTMDFLPCRAADLPSFAPGWYFMNGDKYSTTGPQGLALLALPATFRSDWSIVSAGGLVNVPDWFDSDGYGFFPRAVDGSDRQVGTVQEDAIRNITGFYGGVTSHRKAQDDDLGALYKIVSSASYTVTTQSYGYNDLTYMGLDAGLAVPTADENRPRNRGLLPCIRLGV